MQRDKSNSHLTAFSKFRFSHVIGDLIYIMKKLTTSKGARDWVHKDTGTEALYRDFKLSTPPHGNSHCYAVYTLIKTFGKVPYPRAAPQKVYTPLTREQAEKLGDMFNALCTLEDRLDIVHGVPPQGSLLTAISSSIKMSSMHTRRALVKSTPALIAS